MNPYYPPQGPQNAWDDRARRDHLFRIARDQRMINWIVLAYFGTSVFTTTMQDTLGTQAVVPIRILVGLVAIGIIIAGVVYAVRMASALHGTGIAVLCAILLLVPCVGLLTLLVLNSQATTQLKRAGLQVGLLGVDPSQFNNWR
jgi:hypothetical protein